ncbi:MAG: nucleotidyltransferase family protein [Oligoflexia bacterium]|nr:nucleotidyltransferase family protein [Oligoflexia bacterium]
MSVVFILCAGRGKRLESLTDNISKVMLPVSGRPLLEWTIIHCKRLGFTQIVLNLHFNGEQIKEHFSDGKKWGVKICYLEEDHLLGTAGAIHNAKSFLEGEENFLVLYGDVITNYDYRSLLIFHKKHSFAVATIVVHERRNSNSIIEVDRNNLVTRFVERPLLEEIEKRVPPYWVNSGIYCFSNKIFEYIPSKYPSDLPRDVFGKLVDEGTLYAIPIEGYRCAVDSPERYQEVQFAYKNKIISINDQLLRNMM